MLTEGQTFAGAYRITRALGEVEGRLVYAAEQVATGAPRRIEIHPGAADPAWRDRFLANSRSAPRIDSPFVDPVLDAGASDEGAWIVTAHEEGETLAALLERRGHLPIDEAKPILLAIGGALAAAHAVGLAHGDLRPEHVVVKPAAAPGLPPSVRVGGFGVGRLWAALVLAEPVSAALPPGWQWQDPDTIQHGAGARAQMNDDLWPYALIAFRTLAGKAFWKGETMGAVMQEVAVDPIPPASTRAAELGAPGALPPTFDTWFWRALQRDRNKRFPDMATAVSALTAVFDPLQEPDLILANPKGSFYDEGLVDLGVDTTSGKQGPYRDQVQRVQRPPGDMVILANPKGSFYDRGLTPSPRRWPVFVALALLIAGAIAAVLVRR